MLATVALVTVAAVMVLGPAVGGLAFTASAAQAAASEHIHIVDFDYDPDPATVAVGTTVDWDNHDAAPHTVTDRDDAFDSGNMDEGDTFQWTFDDPGIYEYFCTIHGFDAELVVEVPGALPDLAVTDIQAEDWEPIPGRRQRIQATVVNDGTNPMTGTSEVVFTYRYKGADHLIGSFQVPRLDVGEEKTGRVFWDTQGKVGDFVVTATVDPGDAVGEESEVNNEARVVAQILVGGVDGQDATDPDLPDVPPDGPAP